MTIPIVSDGTVSVSSAGWTQFGANAEHTGAMSVRAQEISRVLASFEIDPFVGQERAQQGGILKAHYQAPLLDHSDVFIESKSGSAPHCEPLKSKRCETTIWDKQVWGEKRLRWEGGRLVTAWLFQSDWKPEPDGEWLDGWEPVFHPALGGDVIYVPGFGGTVYLVARNTGVPMLRVNPFGTTINPGIFVAGPITVDRNENAYYNAVSVETIDSGRPDNRPHSSHPSPPRGWLVKVGRNGSVATVDYTTLVPNAPEADDVCTVLSTPSSNEELDQSHRPLSSTVPCGVQRPGINVAPAVGPDGVIYTVSRAYHFLAAGYSYVVAVNPDLTSRWAVSLRASRQACGRSVLKALPNCGPEGQGLIAAVDDRATSSPTVVPDGGVVYGAKTNWDGFRGRLFRFASNGDLVAVYPFGWDTTAAVYEQGNSYSLITKENTYGASELSSLVQLDSALKREWVFHSPSSAECSAGKPLASFCSTQRDERFNWCVNTVAVDATGTVYAINGDGYLYAVRRGLMRQRLKLTMSGEEAYTPISLAPDGTVYVVAGGQVYVVASEPRP